MFCNFCASSNSVRNLIRLFHKKHCHTTFLQKNSSNFWLFLSQKWWGNNAHHETWDQFNPWWHQKQTLTSIMVALFVVRFKKKWKCFFLNKQQTTPPWCSSAFAFNIVMGWFDPTLHGVHHCLINFVTKTVKNLNCFFTKMSCCHVFCEMDESNREPNSTTHKNYRTCFYHAMMLFKLWFLIVIVVCCNILKQQWQKNELLLFTKHCNNNIFHQKNANENTIIFGTKVKNMLQNNNNYKITIWGW